VTEVKKKRICYKRIRWYRKYSRNTTNIVVFRLYFLYHLIVSNTMGMTHLKIAVKEFKYMRLDRQ